MAAYMSPGDKKEEFKTEFLTCSICAEPYDNEEHQAKCLPCLHAYCKSCLQKIAEKRSQINCPQCRKQIILPGGAVSNLPNNFVVENLKEYQKLFDHNLLCGNCDRDELAVGFCHDCACFQCQRCTDNHQEMRSMRIHQLATIEELQAKKCNPIIQQQHHCTKHPKQDMTMYCREADCKIPVCATCGHLDHRGHDLIELSAAIEKIVGDVQLSSKKVTKRNHELVRKRLAVEELKKTLTSNYEKAEKEIQEVIQKLHEQIDANLNKAQTHLKTLYETEMDSMTSSTESINFLVIQMTSACEFAKQSCDMSHPTQLLTAQYQIIERLNELGKEEMPKTESDKTDFYLTKKHHSAMVKIQESLQDLCDIRWRPQVDPQQCTIQVGLAGSVKQKRRAIVESVDNNGERMMIGGTKVAATQGAVSLGVQDNNDGTYTIEYDSCGSSQTLHVTMDGTEIKGSPFNVQSEVDPHKCTIQLGLPSEYRMARRALVQTIDANGHKMPVGNAKVEATQGKDLRRGKDNGDGTYVIDYDVDLAGESGVLHVKINGTDMIGSPFNILPQIDPEKCMIQLGLPSERSRVGRGKAVAKIHTVDVNGHKMTIGNANIKAMQGSRPLREQDNNDGTYTVEYDSYWGSPTLHVTINGTKMKGSPFKTLPVVDPQKCTIQLGLPSGHIRVNKAVVQTVDINGQKMTTSNARIEATHGVISLEVQDNTDGTYTIEYDSHWYSDTNWSSPPPLYVKINGTEMKGSPFHTGSLDPSVEWKGSPFHTRSLSQSF